MGFLQNRQVRAATRNLQEHFDSRPSWYLDSQTIAVSFNALTAALYETLDADEANDPVGFTKAATEAVTQLQVLEILIARIPLPGSADRVAELVAIREGIGQGVMPNHPQNRDAFMRVAAWVDQVSRAVA